MGTFPVLIMLISLTSIFNIDVLLVKHFFDSINAGYYAALSLLGKMIFFGSWSVSMVMFSKVSEAYALNKNYKNILKKGISKIQYERLREKGIDVKLATDLIVGAIDDKYDVAVVVSSDADIIPAIDWIRNRTHKKIEYVGFSITDGEDNKKSATPSLTLMARTDIQRTLVASDLKPFLQEILFDKNN